MTTDSLYPEILPSEVGMLDVGDGHRLYWEVSGDPRGRPVVFLHGGPGAGTADWHRRLFDPARYRIVLFDQRGCGRSTPHASEPEADLRHVTTAHLVSDIERLREHLGIDGWQVFGGSWGSTLALAYAQAHSERVDQLILRGVFLLRRAELEWFYEGGAAVLVPDLWERFVETIPEDERSGMIEAYRCRLFDPDPAVHTPAAIAWSRWEASTSTVIPDDAQIAALSDPRTATAFARLENHFFTHRGWMEEGQLLRGIDRIRHIPTVIVQGRLDLCTPLTSAWDLHTVWPEADLIVIEGAGHSASEPGIQAALRAATDRFAVEEPAQLGSARR